MHFTVHSATVQYRLRYRPVGEAARVAQVPQVEHVAEQLGLEVRVAHGGDGEVGVASAHVGTQARSELADVRCHFHY